MDTHQGCEERRVSAFLRSMISIELRSPLPQLSLEVWKDSL